MEAQAVFWFHAASIIVLLLFSLKSPYLANTFSFAFSCFNNLSFSCSLGHYDYIHYLSIFNVLESYF